MFGKKFSKFKNVIDYVCEYDVIIRNRNSNLGVRRYDVTLQFRKQYTPSELDDVMDLAIKKGYFTSVQNPYKENKGSHQVILRPTEIAKTLASNRLFWLAKRFGNIFFGMMVLEINKLFLIPIAATIVATLILVYIFGIK